MPFLVLMNAQDLDRHFCDGLCSPGISSTNHQKDERRCHGRNRGAWRNKNLYGKMEVSFMLKQQHFHLPFREARAFR